MIKVKIFSIGKTKESWLEEALQEYTKRLKSTATFEWLWAKNNDQLIEWVESEDSVICLDPNGKLMTSEQFANLVEKGGSRLSFVIGGAEGLPEKLKKNYFLLSLSPLTLTHQMTRLLLIEQIYRAFEIKKGSQYHK